MLERKENIILLKTDAFGDRIVKLYNYLRAEKQEFVMSKQILRSGTSIGANAVESKNAQGTKDFVNKLSIALKEADETQYWLKKLYHGDYLTKPQFESMNSDNEEIVRILTKNIKTTKERM